MKAFIFWVGRGCRAQTPWGTMHTYPFTKAPKTSRACMPRLFFLHRNLNLELLNYFSLSPLSLRSAGNIGYRESTKGRREGREREGGERKSNRGVATSGFGSHDGWMLLVLFCRKINFGSIQTTFITQAGSHLPNLAAKQQSTSQTARRRRWSPEAK